MSKSIQRLFILATVVLISFVALFFFIGEGGLMERIRFDIRSDLLTENARLSTQNKKLTRQLTELRQQNRYLKKVLVGRTFRFSILEQTADDGLAVDATVSQAPSNDLPAESFSNRQIYRALLAEQSLIPLAPSALGELDFFSRRLAQSLVQLHEAGSQGLMDSTILDMEALEREMQ